MKNFRFPVEVIEVETYQGVGDDHIYRFTPLFKDVSDVKESIEEREQRFVDISEFDTIVVPAREEGFKKTFFGGKPNLLPTHPAVSILGLQPPLVSSVACAPSLLPL